MTLSGVVYRIHHSASNVILVRPALGLSFLCLRKEGCKNEVEKCTQLPDTYSPTLPIRRLLAHAFVHVIPSPPESPSSQLALLRRRSWSHPCSSHRLTYTCSSHRLTYTCSSHRLTYTCSSHRLTYTCSSHRLTYTCSSHRLTYTCSYFSCPCHTRA
jgi:hypothetical protein